MGISLEFHLESGGIHRNLIFLPFRQNPNGIPTFRGIPAESAGTHGGGYVKYCNFPLSIIQFHHCGMEVYMVSGIFLNAITEWILLLLIKLRIR